MKHFSFPLRTFVFSGKALILISTDEFGIYISPNDEHPAKAHFSILFKGDEINTWERDEHWKKAWFLITETVLGIFISFSDVHLSNTDSAIEEIVQKRATFSKEAQL